MKSFNKMKTKTVTIRSLDTTVFAKTSNIWRCWLAKNLRGGDALCNNKIRNRVTYSGGLKNSYPIFGIQKLFGYLVFGFINRTTKKEGIMKRCAFIMLLIPGILFGAYNGFLGIYPTDLSEGMKVALKVEYGVLVSNVVKDSPADKAGLKTGDVILALDGEMVENVVEFHQGLSDREASDEVTLKVLREGVELEVKAVLGERSHGPKPPYGAFGGGGGPHIMWFSPDLSVINNKLKDCVGTFGEGMILTGGGGGGSISRNIWIGGMGYGGSKTVTGNGRKATLSISGGGFQVEYKIPVYQKIHLFLGGVVGGGGIDLEITRVNRALSWDDIWDNLKSDSISADDYEVHLSAPCSHYRPYVGIEFPITSFCWLKTSVGYFGIKTWSWECGDIELTSYPEMNLSNYCVDVGLTFGFYGL